MATITSTGVGSGLDVNTIITQLMVLERRPLDLLQKQSTSVQSQLSAFGSLKSQIAALGDVATKLSDITNWNPVRSESSAPDKLGISTTSKAAVGTHRVEVQQLAQAQSLVSTGFAGPATAIGTGSLMIEIGTTSGATFTAKSGTPPVIIPVGSGNNTLAGVRDAINAAGSEFTASIVSSGGTSRLVLRGAEGAEHSIRITVSDSDGNSTDNAGLSALAWDPSAPVGAGRNLVQSMAAQDAAYTLDGISLMSATNAPSDVLEGLSLSLKQVTDNAVTISVASDTTVLKKNVTDFAKAYNDLNRLVRSYTQSDPTGANRGALQADSTVSSLSTQLRGLLQGAVQGLGGAASLSAAGVEIQRDGSLLVADTKLSPLLKTPTQLAALFGQIPIGNNAATGGFAQRLQAWAKAITGDTGLLATRTEGLQRRQDFNQRQQTVAEDRISRTEFRLRAQYQKLDTEMSRLKSSLASIDNLTS